MVTDVLTKKEKSILRLGELAGKDKEQKRILKLVNEMDSIPCPFCGGENSECTTCHGKDDIRVFSYEELKQKIE